MSGRKVQIDGVVFLFLLIAIPRQSSNLGRESDLSCSKLPLGQLVLEGVLAKSELLVSSSLFDQESWKVPHNGAMSSLHDD